MAASLMLSQLCPLPCVSSPESATARVGPCSVSAKRLGVPRLPVRKARRFSAAVALGEGDNTGASVETVGAGNGGSEREQVDILPSGEWAHNFSILNYEDLSKHYEEKGEQPAADPSSPLLPDKSHGVVSGEWSESISILSYEDLSTYFQQQIFKQDAMPESLIADVMRREVRYANPEDTFGKIAHHFDSFTGLPVVDENLVCIGVVSKEDRARAGSDDAKVKDFMTSPPKVTITPDKTVLFAAVLMLKNKVHRLPVVNDAGQLVGILTRTDVFTVLEADK